MQSAVCEQECYLANIAYLVQVLRVLFKKTEAKTLTIEHGIIWKGETQIAFTVYITIWFLDHSGGPM